MSPVLTPDAREDGKSRSLFHRYLVPVALGTWLLLSYYGSLFVLLGQTKDGLSDGTGHPFGDCFINFWSAARLAMNGQIADIYNWDAFHAFQQNTVNADLVLFHYSYPPVMPLLTLPLAWLPYVAGFVAWTAVTWAFFYLALRAAKPSVNALFLSLAVPAFLFNAVAGQNGTLTAALLGGGLGLLPRRPVAAGILFGLLCFKPQLVFLVPLALLCGRQWRVLAVAALTSLVLVAVSVALFGPDVWIDYLHVTQKLRSYVLENDVPHSWKQFISIFVLARQLGAGITLAYAVQGIFALAAAFAVVKLWAGEASHDVRCAALVTGTFLATPYAMNYDLVVTAFVAVWLGRSYRHHRWATLPLLLTPLLSTLAGAYTGLSIGPLLLLPAFALTLSSCGVPGFARR
jgi:arabinofuranan 3-O-arabinosyltransferase